MPDAASLLPSNATELERDLSQSTDFLARLPQAGQLIRSSKRQNIPDSVVPWLIYEYGLGELLPFLTDPRTAIADGVQWQRLRGTPESFRIALGWVGNTGTIEESEAGTIRWSQFQLGLAQAPNGLSGIDSVVELARLSSPVRSKLFRVHGGYDHRRFWLDDSILSSGSWLADHTGVYLRDDWPQLSFGRQHQTALDLFATRGAELGTETIHTDGNRYEDKMLLSNSHLSDLLWRTWHLSADKATISRLHFTAAGPYWQRQLGWYDGLTKTWTPGTWQAETWEGNATSFSWDQAGNWDDSLNALVPHRKFAKAGIYLSDTEDGLGDTNACFPAKYTEEVTDAVFVLSEGDSATGEGILSEHVATFTDFEILERIDRDHKAEAGPLGTVGGVLGAIRREHQRLLAYDDVFRLDQHLLSEHPFLLNELAIGREHTTVALFHTLLMLQWGQASWTQVAAWANHNGLDVHGTQNKAHLYLSEDEALGDTNAVLGWPTDERFERNHHSVPQQATVGFVTRQHTRESFVTWQRFVEPTWGQTAWGGQLTGWVTGNEPWVDATNNWHHGATDGWANSWGQSEWVNGHTGDWASTSWADGDTQNWNNVSWLEGSSPTDWTQTMWGVERTFWQAASSQIDSRHQTHT